MADFTYKNSQNLTPAQVTALWQQVGAPASIAHAFGYGVAPAEGGGQTGVVLNTAYPSLPNYSAPGAGASPEYSVGLYGLNIYGDLSPQPTPQEAYQIGQNLAANPLYQTKIAAQMFSQRGFEPWTDTYVSGAGGPSALLSSLGYSSPPQISGGVPFTGFVPSNGKGSVPPGNLDQGAAIGGSGPAGVVAAGPAFGQGGALSPSTLTENSQGQSWFGLSLGGTWSKALGYGIAVGGALTIFVGIFVMVKSETGLTALARALTSSQRGSTSSPAPSLPNPAPAAQTVTEAPQETSAQLTPEPAAGNAELDGELAAYYKGVEDGLEAPRARTANRRPVGVYHEADEGEF